MPKMRPSNPNDPVAKRLKEARLLDPERKQEGWAELLRVTKAAVSHWEQGRTRPTYETLGDIADQTGLTLDYVVAGRAPRLSKERAGSVDPIRKRLDSLPETLQEYVMGALAFAEDMRAVIPDEFVAPPTSKNWPAFNAYLQRLADKLHIKPKSSA